jgi:hypothetical protein
MEYNLKKHFLRRSFTIILTILFVHHVSAQGEVADTMSIQAAFEACIAMRNAIASNNVAAIKKSAEKLKKCKTRDFNSLRCNDNSVTTLSGHVVFDELFAEAVAEGWDYKNVTEDDNNDQSPNVSAQIPSKQRGQTADGSILTKTCFVKAGKSTKYSFASKGHQELAVVAEAGGLVTMKIHVTNSSGFDRRFDDTKNVKKGMPHRKTSFELPSDKRNTVELEVINCCNKDISFVVISN